MSYPLFHQNGKEDFYFTSTKDDKKKHKEDGCAERGKGLTHKGTGFEPHCIRKRQEEI